MPSTFVDRALAAYTAMRESMAIADGRGLYHLTADATSPVAYLWEFSRALLGTLCLAGIRGDLSSYTAAARERLRALDHYWTGSAYASAVFPPGGDLYHDDNAWVALAQLLAYRMGLSRDLSRVKRVWTFAKRGWDRSRSDPYPGGVFWVQQGMGYGLSNHDRGAGATAGSAEIGFHLWELTGSSFKEATTMVDWVAQYLDQSGSGGGPFLNVVRRDGTIDTNVWSYNQGVVLGCRVLQYRLTGDLSFLRSAEAIARQTLSTFGTFENHPPSFNAMCFQNLLMLHAATSDRTLRSNVQQAMRTYADWAWNPATGARDERTNLFHFDDAGHPALATQPARVQDQGAMTQLFALLAWDPADYHHLT